MDSVQIKTTDGTIITIHLNQAPQAGQYGHAGPVRSVKSKRATKNVNKTARFKGGTKSNDQILRSSPSSFIASVYSDKTGCRVKKEL